ncbi:MAG: hypothetical protein M3P00_11440 [Gemmatimonadota bacterium]|nr:hypothetical protein [Gemmatimonadota bacterium]
MATVLPITQSDGAPTARIEGDALVLDGFHEHDAQVVALAENAENIDALVHDCLAVGARALTAAQATTDVAVVEKAFGDMTDSFSRGLEEFSEEFAAKTKELLDEEQGALPRSLGEFKSEIEELLDGTFDPESKVSALAKLEEVMRKASADQVRAVRSLIDPENEDSPLGRYRTEIVKSVEKETSKLQAAFEELRSQIAVDEAKAEMFELTTKKGFTFEEELESRLIGICQPCGDVAERVGGTPGARGKKGDFVIRINPDDVAGQDVCFTVEAKNRRMPLRDILKELDACMANRDASASVAVFAKQEQCPGDSPFQAYGNRAVVVYDVEEGELALRLALAWGRWVVRRQLSAVADAVDLDRIGSLIESARQALRTQSTIDRALTTSANKITEAKGHLASLVADVEAALASVEREIAA